MSATHPLIVGGGLTSADDVNYGGDDTGPERYFIDHTYHYSHIERNAIANRRSRSSASMSSISIDSVDEAAWSEATRRILQEAGGGGGGGGGGGSHSNRLRTIGEQRPASLTSVDFTKLNYHTSEKNGYVSFSPAPSRPFPPNLGHGYPSTDSLMYSHSDRSGTSTPLASPITTPDVTAAMISFEDSLMAPPSLKKTNRIPPRWRSEQRVTTTGGGAGPRGSSKGHNHETDIPHVISADSDEEDDIETKNTTMPPWDSSIPIHTSTSSNNVFRSPSTSTQSEESPLLNLLTDHLMDMSCSFLDSVNCSRSFENGDSGGNEHNCRAKRDDSFATEPTLISF